jgi:hypothetical protein
MAFVAQGATKRLRRLLDDARERGHDDHAPQVVPRGVLECEERGRKVFPHRSEP